MLRSLPISLFGILLTVAPALAMPAKPTHDRLLKFDNIQRKTAWTKLLQLSGESCAAATRTFFQM